ncbi:hypothetical protein ABTM62_20495, partial [Acinetobacter baumannii]
AATFAREARAGFPATYPYSNQDSPFWNRASVIEPSRRYNLDASAGYDFNSTTHLYGQFQFNNRVSGTRSLRQLFPT